MANLMRHVVAIVAALCIVFSIFLSSALAQEDPFSQISVSAPEYAECRKRLTTCAFDMSTSQSAAEKLGQTLEAQSQRLASCGLTLVKSGTVIVDLKKTAPAPAPVAAPLPPLPALEKLKCKPCEEIEALKARFGKLESALAAQAAAQKGSTKLPDLDPLLKRLEELTKRLEEDPASVAGIAKQYENLRNDFALLLIRVGRVEFVTEGMRKLLCWDNPTTSAEVLKFCGATQTEVRFGLKGRGSWLPGTPGKFGVVAELSVTHFPGAAASGFTFGAAGGVMQGARWAKDTSYVARGFAGGISCTSRSRSTCFRVTGFVEGLLWARPANGSDLNPKARDGLKGQPGGFGFGLSLGVSAHITERVWFSVDVDPITITPGMNFLTSDGRVGISRGWYGGAAFGFGGTWDGF